MGSKEDAYRDLSALMKRTGIAPSTIGRELAGDPGFMWRLADPTKSISTKTLDNVYRYILKKEGQLELDLEKGKK